MIANRRSLAALLSLAALTAAGCANDVRVLHSASPIRGVPNDGDSDGASPTPQGTDGGGQCSEGPSQTTVLGPYLGPNGVSVEIKSDTLTPQLGDHQSWDLIITDGNGDDIPADTSVTVECVMMHSGGFTHGCPAMIQVVRPGGANFYTAAPVIFNMQGYWTMTIHVGDLDTVSFGYCAR